MTIRTISATGLDLIKYFEGRRLHRYKCPAGVWTVGYGHVLTNEELSTLSDPIDVATADVLLAKDVWKFEAALYTEQRTRRLPPLKQGELDALVSFTFNVGLGAFDKSTLRRLLCDDVDRSVVAAQFARWNKAGGKVLPGLVARREAERKLFLYGGW